MLAWSIMVTNQLIVLHAMLILIANDLDNNVIIAIQKTSITENSADIDKAISS